MRRLPARGASSTDADLIDAGVIFGTGFAPFRGGPLTYARARGSRPASRDSSELAQRYGARFRPDAGWKRTALRRAMREPRSGKRLC